MQNTKHLLLLGHIVTKEAAIETITSRPGLIGLSKDIMNLWPWKEICYYVTKSTVVHLAGIISIIIGREDIFDATSDIVPEKTSRIVHLN